MRAIARLFTAGWQPTEVVRQARRDGGATQAALAATAIVAHHSCLKAEPVDPRWQRQLDELAASAFGDGRSGPSGWFAEWSDAVSLAPDAELMETFELLVTIRSLPPIEELIPPPGSRTTGEPSRSPGDLSDDDHQLPEAVGARAGRRRQPGSESARAVLNASTSA